MNPLKKSLSRILASILIVALVFGSLITFPVYLPWMAALWGLLSLIAFARNRPMWPWLIGGVLIIAIKRPGFTIELMLLFVVYLAVACWDWRTIRKETDSVNLRRLLIYSLVLMTATTIYGGTRWLAANTSQKLVADERPLACLGDSLTDFGYPEELAKLVSVPIADFGVNGITTDEGIKMIPKILAADPQLVVIELGGHDYNAEQKTRSATRTNLIKLIEAFRNEGIAVVLVEIPRGFISDPYDGLERELAAKYDLQLIDDSLIRSFVFNSSIMPPGSWRRASQRYSDDGLHPNELGNKRFARVVRDSLARIFGDSILR